MAKSERVPVAVLRDASQRDASQDEGSVCRARTGSSANRRMIRSGAARSKQRGKFADVCHCFERCDAADNCRMSGVLQ